MMKSHRNATEAVPYLHILEMDNGHKKPLGTHKTSLDEEIICKRKNLPFCMLLK